MLRITSLFVVLFYGASAEVVPDLGTNSSCFPTFMRVEVDLTKNPDLVAGDIHLNDRNCKATQTSPTFAVFDIPLHSCGTVQDGSHPDYLLFSNTVRWQPTPSGNKGQTRTDGFASQVTCRYNRNGNVDTSVLIQPFEEVTVGPPAKDKMTAHSSTD
ncbi:Zona pellucida (ZP) domain [Desmophyllum pertusum]|uniref:Zona pellucida (ZP) domain n=1 Tax=Desmophyllum pertusum TaxID=174260 RepID=A0A9W9Z842_9CNID|nr:Zona pellucida (ZP) domain [Desmophyllum pertusum]